jgi:hypothetical protein
MDIAREQILSELESHISRSVQLMRQVATVGNAEFHDNAELWLESLETDLRLLRRLCEELELIEKIEGES